MKRREEERVGGVKGKKEVGGAYEIRGVDARGAEGERRRDAERMEERKRGVWSER